MDKMDEESRKALDAEKVKAMREAVEGLAKVQHDSAFEQADLNGKINILLNDRLKIQNEMTGLHKGTVEYIQKETELAKIDGQIEKQLADERQKAAEKAKKATEERIQDQKTIAGSVQEEIEFLTLQAKMTQGIATGPEKDRLNQIQLQRQERATELELEKLAQKAIEGELTPAEKKRFAELEKQKAKLDAQLDAQEKLIKGAVQEKEAQAAVTDEYEKQIEAANKLNGFSGTQVGVSGGDFGGFVQQESSAALGGTIQQIEAKLNAVGSNGLTTLKNADINSNFGDWMTTSILKQQLDVARKEQDLRANVAQYASRYGESAARAQFGDTVTQRALSNLADQSNRAAIATERISQQLSAAGFGVNGPR